MNSVFGRRRTPDHPDGKLALVANSMRGQDGGAGSRARHQALRIDLTTSPPRTSRRWRSANSLRLAINARRLALVTNRATTRSACSRSRQGGEADRHGGDGEMVAPSRSRPTAARVRGQVPGTRSRCSRSTARRSRTRSTTCRRLWPYNIDITPNGKLASRDNGNAGLRRHVTP